MEILSGGHSQSEGSFTPEHFMLRSDITEQLLWFYFEGAKLPVVCTTADQRGSHGSKSKALWSVKRNHAPR